MGSCDARKLYIIQLSINRILKRILEKLNESDVIGTEIQVKMLRLIKLSQYKFRF